MAWPKKPIGDRLLAYSELRDGTMADQCWVWQRGLNNKGYGRLSAYGNRYNMVHRVAYMFWVGRIPDGLDIDHLCRNRACINPSHLEPVTRSENLRRGHAARGTTAGPNSARDANRRFELKRQEARRLAREQKLAACG